MIGDLLVRHRRRCQGPIKPQNRRKACDACVAAKTRCSYEQPTCSRCARRATPCVYAYKLELTDATNLSMGRLTQDSDMDTSESSDASPTSPAGPTLIPCNAFSSTTTAEVTTPFLWDVPGASSWPLESFDMSMHLTAQDPISMMTLGTNVLTDTVMPKDLGMTTTFPFPGSNGLTHLQSPVSTGAEPLSSAAWDLPHSMQSMPLSHNFSASNGPMLPSMSSLHIAQILVEYPTKLLCEPFKSPLLHHSLYNDAVADAATLPLTSMAICCGIGMESRRSRRFVKRTMHAERQRLVKAFPSYQSMQQWDALHATLIYGVIELRERFDDDLETWKSKPEIDDLQSSSCFKMAQCYVRSYPALHNTDINAFSDPESAPNSTMASAWGRWRITEIARRTKFFANMVNFYLNPKHGVEQQLPYYQALDDDLILNMPLPCSDRAWTAKDESSWMGAIEADHSSPALHLASGMSPSGGPYQIPTLKSLFSQYSKDFLQRDFVQTAGLDDSDKLRSLIIICACEQFP
ncbi:hypothetical protein CC86DRAFT_282564 [Ophiobolus disseminans]|uniref:Zn(2)-C6 fungal-type domain-containing protein n=1 Tax=Ophiobolus disseminans TaxID=1469910 RepID=A0A6A7AG09_9PLEO|nr:hypothetical protein CC86DRAFT_282564 [Ophiobolus disseminans]